MPTGETPRQVQWTFTKTPSPSDDDGLPSLAEATFEPHRHGQRTPVRHGQPLRWADIMRVNSLTSFGLSDRQHIFVSGLNQELDVVQDNRRPKKPNYFLFPGGSASQGEKSTIAGVLDRIGAFPDVVNEISGFYGLTPEAVLRNQGNMRFGAMLRSLQFLADPERRLAQIAPHLAHEIQILLLPDHGRSACQDSADSLRGNARVIQTVVDDLFAVTSGERMAKPRN